MSRKHRRSSSRASFPAAGKKGGRGVLRAWWVVCLVVITAVTGVVVWPRWPLLGLPRLPAEALEGKAAAFVAERAAAVRKAPQSGAAWGELGAVLRSYGFAAEARHCLETAERLDPEEARWPYLLSLMEARSAPAAAIGRLRRVVALKGGELDMPRLQLARLLAEQGQWEEAEREFSELQRRKGDHAAALLGLAHAARARGDLSNAVGLAQPCVTNATTAKAAWTLLAAAYQRLGDTNAALTASRKAAAAAPDVTLPDPLDSNYRVLAGDARALSDQAQQYLMAGRPDDARALIGRLEQDYPQVAETWLLQGRMRNLQKRSREAEQSLRRHLEMEPTSVNGWFQLGMSLLAQQRYEEAADVFGEAIRLKIDFGPAYFNRGFALAKAGKKVEAVQPFREAIRHSPEYIDSYILLADLLLQMGQKAAAMELAEQARNVNPSDRRLATLREKVEQQ